MTKNANPIPINRNPFSSIPNNLITNEFIVEPDAPDNFLIDSSSDSMSAL